jgi:hypothetical protein
VALQQVEEFLSGYGHHAQAGEVVVRELAVDQRHVFLARQFHQRDLGGVGDAAEHGFAEEDVPELHAVDAAGEASVVPALDGAPVAELEQLVVGAQHFGGDPGTALALARFGAAQHHFAVGLVVRDHERLLPQRLVQAARDVDRVREDDGAPRGAPPQDRFALVVPGKDPAVIGEQQALGAQAAPGGQQAVGFGEGGFHVREGFGIVVGIQPGYHRLRTLSLALSRLRNPRHSKVPQPRFPSDYSGVAEGR